MKLEKEVLTKIYGGAITASFINAIVDGFQKIFDFGRTVGSAISRFVSKNWC